MLVLVRIRRSMGDPVESRDEIARTATTDEPDRPEPRPSTFAWPTATRVLAVCSCLCGDQWRPGHLCRHRLPPHARSRCTGRSRSVDLCRGHGRGGTCRARIRLALRSHQGRCLIGPAAPGVRRAGSGVQRLAADRHCRCAAVGRGWRSAGLQRSRRWWPTSSPPHGSPPRTVCSPLCRAQPPSAVASWPVHCTSDHSPC